MTCIGFRLVVKAVAAGLALTLAGGASASTVYKWTDERGVVNYSTAPPPDARRPVAINTAFAIENRDPAALEEARYWREKRQREALRDVEERRVRREAEEGRDALVWRQAYAASLAAEAASNQRRQAYDQCMRQRRIDCDNPQAGSSYGYGYPSPVIEAGRSHQSIGQAAPFPVGGGYSLGIAPGTIAGTQAQLAPFVGGTSFATRSAVSTGRHTLR